nr:MAG TPA: hypothetical protein [Crassvirales sp.]
MQNPKGHTTTPIIWDRRKQALLISKTLLKLHLLFITIKTKSL